MNYINIVLVINNSNSKFLKRFSGFAVRLIAWIIRQIEIHDKYSDFEGIDFLLKTIEEVEIKFVFECIENLPESGKCFFVANHPYGLWDGVIITFIMDSKYGRFKAIGFTFPGTLLFRKKGKTIYVKIGKIIHCNNLDKFFVPLGMDAKDSNRSLFHEIINNLKLTL